MCLLLLQLCLLLLQYPRLVCVCVNYCSTYYKAAVCGGPGGARGGEWVCVCLLLQYLLQSVCVFITAGPITTLKL